MGAFPPRFNGDSVLPLLFERIQKHQGRKPLDVPENRWHRTPQVQYISLTHASQCLPSAMVVASQGRIIEDTLNQYNLMDHCLRAEVHVGTEQGAGIGVYSRLVPQQEEGLEDFVDDIIDRAFAAGVRDYDHHLMELREGKGFLARLAMIPPAHSLGSIAKTRISPKRLQMLAREASQLLSTSGSVGTVTLQVIEESRRLVTSEGTVVRDSFFGYYLRFEMESRTKEGQLLRSVQPLHFTRDYPLREAEILRFARGMAQDVEKRRDCPQLEPGRYLVLLGPKANATLLHEAFAHYAASDEQLQNEPWTVWTTHTFGKRKINPRLSIYSDPGLPGKWGSFSHDAEGVPAQRHALIHEGVVVGSLADRRGAYRLNQKTGREIVPGDAKLGFDEEGGAYSLQPRLSNLVAEYQGKKQSRKQLLQRMVQELQARGEEKGLYLPDDPLAECFGQGNFTVFPDFPIILYADGRQEPTRFIQVQGNVFTYLNNILAWGSRNTYCPQWCGGEEMATVRGGVVCSDALVDNLTTTVAIPEVQRQMLRREYGKRI